jgi:hypothetical protein
LQCAGVDEQDLVDAGDAHYHTRLAAWVAPGDRDGCIRDSCRGQNHVMDAILIISSLAGILAAMGIAVGIEERGRR